MNMSCLMTGQQERVRRSRLSKTPWDISSQGHKPQASARSAGLSLLPRIEKEVFMQQRKQHTAFAVDGYAITASFADCKNAAALHHVKQILLSSFVNNTVKNSSGDILAIPPEQRDNNSGGSPYVP